MCMGMGECVVNVFESVCVCVYVCQSTLRCAHVQANHSPATAMKSLPPLGLPDSVVSGLGRIGG